MATAPGITTRRIRGNGPDVRGKRGIAFIVEALVLLFFLVLAVTVFVQLLGGAVVRGQQATDLENAVQIAQDSAEAFAADPQTFQPESRQGDYEVEADVQRTATSAGALYRATIRVVKSGTGSIYELSTARYVEGPRTGLQSQNAAQQQAADGQPTPDAQQSVAGESNG